MKAVLALIVIYVGTFLVAIQGASNSPVEASAQSATAANQGITIDPVKEKEIRSLLELLGTKDAVQESASLATDEYRQKVVETSVNSDRAQVFTNAFFSEFQKKFDADVVTGQLAGIYDKHFTEEEIKGLLEFYGSPLGQKVAAEMPKISREVQQTTRAASNQAARLAWQDLRTEYPNAGENVRGSGARRRGLAPGAAAQSPTAKSTGTEQVSADSQRP